MRKWLLAAVIILLPSVSWAAECNVQLDNSGEIKVNDERKAVFATSMFGLVGAAISGVGSNSRQSMGDEIILNRLKRVDVFSIIKGESPGLFINKSDRDCLVNIKIKNININYSSMTWVIFDINIEKISKENISNLANRKFSARIFDIPAPYPPKKLFKKVGPDRWQDVTPPTPSADEAVENFVPKFEQSIQKIGKKLIADKLVQ